MRATKVRNKVTYDKESNSAATNFLYVWFNVPLNTLYNSFR